MTGLPSTCAVLGGGRMGSGIAHALLLARGAVIVLEADDAAAAAAQARIAGAVEESARRKPGSIDAERVSARLAVTTDYEHLASAGLVIEALPEQAALKQAALKATEAVAADDAVIATNTSSLSIDLLADALSAHERFLGMHFFNPVPASNLVEIVTGTATAAHVTEAVHGWVTELGKTPIVVRNCPGFASSRLGVALGLEAIRMVEEGVASVEDIDTAMVLGYKHPVGPLKLTDVVGLDVRLDIATYLNETLGDRFAVPRLMQKMVERGDLGRKTGKGFYTW